MNSNRPINPQSIGAPAARYHHAVLTQAGSRMLHTSGVVPISADGSVPNELVEQAEVVWRNIGDILVDAEMSFSDIVSITTYVVLGEPLGPVMAARDKALADHVAASTLVTVPALAQPAWRMEVAVIAASS